MHSRQPTSTWIGSLLLAGMLVFILAGLATAASLDEVKMKGKLLIGVKTDFPPFGYVDSAGKNLGFDVDLARALAQRLFDDENKVELVTVTSGNRIPFLYSEWIDFIIATMTVTDERRQVLEFSEPYFLSGSLLLVPKASTIRGLEDLAGKKVAVIEGAIQDKDLEQVAPKATRIRFGRVSEAIEALKGGRVDAFAQDDVLILSLAKENPDLRAVGKAFIPRPYAIAVRKGERELIKWVNDQLARMKRDGTYEGLWKKHFGDVEAALVKP